MMLKHGLFVGFNATRKRVQREAAEARDVRYAERRERVRALWPAMSVRDIACELDATATSILHDAKLLGLRPRPISAQP